MNGPSIMFLRERLWQYALLTRLNRPIGNFLLLWPTLWALWVAADGVPALQVLTVFMLGGLLMRAAGCVINDYADRNIDGHVQRTRHRPLATGAVTEREALTLFVLLSLTAFGLVLLMNPLTIALSVPAALLAASYPFMKRYTHLPQLHLGVAFGWAVPMAFAAQTGAVPALAWLLFAIVVVWAVIYDTEYAMVDRDDDLRIGVRSTAILFGRHDRLMIGLFQGLMLGLLGLLGGLLALGWPYWLAVLIAAGMFVRQQWWLRTRARDQCFQAFLDNNLLGGVLFVGFAAAYALSVG
jgi:4-hydroxybenzoate polyprenyltransferase